jgi:hypothetical protein
MNSLPSKLIVLSVTLCWLSLPAGAQQPASGNTKMASSAATPRTPDDHPDLSGLWTGSAQIGIPGYGPAGANPAPAPAPASPKPATAGSLDPNLFNVREAEGRTGPEGFITLERDNTILRRMSANRPIYKPQYWETVQQFDQDGNNADPGGNCMPAGVPRVGPPAQIIQTPKQLAMLYLVGGAAANPTTYRVFPIDGRAHTPLDDLDGTFNGESIGHWEGDTLVIDTIGFNTSTWLDIEGYFHSENMHVIERLTRNGDSLIWQATVEDPDVLIRPWVMDSHTVRLNPDPMAVLPESPACSERDYPHAVTKEHH